MKKSIVKKKEPEPETFEEKIIQKKKELIKKYEKKIENIKKRYKLDEIKEVNEEEKEQTTKQYTAIALMEAEKIWLNVEIAVLEGREEFYSKTDEQKIDLIRQDFKEFYDNFPIVSRYMICMLQFSQKAFERFLNKCRIALENMPQKRDEGYMENQWIERQADYVRYLWEETQTRRINKKESDSVWLQAYNSIKKEFKDFKELHKNMEEKVKNDDKKYKTELLREMGERIIKGEQSIEAQELKDLLIKLKNKLYKQRYSKVITQIKEDVKFVFHTIAGVGLNQEERINYDDEMKQSEYKKKYKLSK